MVKPGCYNCQQEIDQSSSIGRRDTCTKCNADLHVCFNCKHYDQSAYNECHETQAERVLDKDRSNFCDYFALGLGKSKGSSDKDALKKLDDLFK